ncbi:MAG: D-alanine--D-alanine ligase [Planctomycetales bacterium]
MSETSPITSGPLRVAVLLGGPSSERAVSLLSGAAVAQALADAGHEVLELDPLRIDLASYDWTGIDVAFIALHGRFGEDGQVQELLEQARVPYTGSDAVASRLAISKSATKARFQQYGVPTAPWAIVQELDPAEHILHEAERVGFPLVVKPDRQGSSLGVTIVREAGLLPMGLTAAFQYDPTVVLEAWIDGTEWTAGFFDEIPLPLIQIVTERVFFDYAAKYQDQGTGYRFAEDMPTEVAQSLEQAAAAACRAVGTQGIARVDLMLDHQCEPWVLEVNTIPGMTDHSLVPKAAAHIGMEFAELCERCLVSALARTRRKTAA